MDTVQKPSVLIITLHRQNPSEFTFTDVRVFMCYHPNLYSHQCILFIIIAALLQFCILLAAQESRYFHFCSLYCCIAEMDS
jgi:hypothetical protein